MFKGKYSIMIMLKYKGPRLSVEIFDAIPCIWGMFTYGPASKNNIRYFNKVK